MNARLRVAHVGGYAPESADGVQKTIFGLLTNLPRQGVDVELWTFSVHTRVPKMTDVDGVPTLELPAHRPPLNLGPLPGISRRAILARTPVVDVVHFHSVFVPENAWTATVLDIPYVITPNGGYGPAVLEGRNRLAKAVWLSAMERSYLRSASAIHTVSPSETNDILNLIGHPRVFMVPNAVDEDMLRGEVKAPRRRDLVFLGRLAVRQKGLDLLLRGFARSVTQHDSRLLIAGPDFRHGRRQCEQLVRSLRIERSVSFCGPMFGVDKKNLLEDCYALVQPSRWEGLPFTVLEALALGRPVVVTEGTNIAALVREYAAGIDVDAHPDAISTGIRDLLNLLPGDYEKMSQNARRLIRDHFTWEESTATMARHYRLLAK
jgi:glycosyltransferase involved in cell wall biosynthesis